MRMLLHRMFPRLVMNHAAQGLVDGHQFIDPGPTAVTGLIAVLATSRRIQRHILALTQAEDRTVLFVRRVRMLALLT